MAITIKALLQEENATKFFTKAPHVIKNMKEPQPLINIFLKAQELKLAALRTKPEKEPIRTTKKCLREQAVQLTEAWLAKYPLLTQPPVAALTSHFHCHKTLFKKLEHPVSKQIEALYTKISATFPKNYAFPDLKLKEVRVLKMFSPDYPGKQASCFKKLWRAVVAAIRNFLMAFQCSAFSQVFQTAAKASREIVAHYRHTAPDKHGGWKTFIEALNPLQDFFYPKAKKPHFRFELLFPYFFVTHPSKLHDPNSELNIFFDFKNIDESAYTNDVALAKHRLELLAHLPAIQKTLRELRTILRANYEETPFCKWFLRPSQAKIKSALDAFATAYFALKDSEPICKAIYEKKAL